MWQPWEKSTVQVHRTSSSPSQLFSCSSFKDIQTLFLDEPLQQPSRSPTTKPSVFHRVRLANSLLRTWSTQQPPKLTRTLSNSQPDPVQVQLQHQLEPDSPLTPLIPGTEQRVVVYYTSLRVVRSTYDACKSVLSILSGFRVQIEDRDVSMESGFSAELNRIMGQTGFALPRVFIGGRYVGGAEEVKQLNEIGELKKMLEKLPVVDLSECHVCGGHRFVLCNACDGSRKVYMEKIGFKMCNNCNENGLLRCPTCFSTPLLSSLDLTK